MSAFLNPEWWQKEYDLIKLQQSYHWFCNIFLGKQVLQLNFIILVENWHSLHHCALQFPPHTVPLLHTHNILYCPCLIDLGTVKSLTISNPLPKNNYWYNYLTCELFKASTSICASKSSYVLRKSSSTKFRKTGNEEWELSYWRLMMVSQNLELRLNA